MQGKLKIAQKSDFSVKKKIHWTWNVPIQQLYS